MPINTEWNTSLYEYLYSQDAYEVQKYAQALKDVDFIEQVIGPETSQIILDIGCGIGRHSMELSKRGFTITGIDISRNMMLKARENARLQNRDAILLTADAKDLRYKDQYDVVLLIFDSPFSIMEDDEENFLILRNATRALKNNGLLIFTYHNALFPLFNEIPDFEEQKLTNKEFDEFSFYHRFRFDLATETNKPIPIRGQQRYYAPSEIHWLLFGLDMTIVKNYECRNSVLSDQYPFTRDSHEVVVVAKKQKRE